VEDLMNLIIYISTSQWLSHEIAPNSSIAHDGMVWQVVPFVTAEDMQAYIAEQNLVEMNPAVDAQPPNNNIQGEDNVM
jgi:hypothetical protein